MLLTEGTSVTVFISLFAHIIKSTTSAGVANRGELVKFQQPPLGRKLERYPFCRSGPNL